MGYILAPPQWAQRSAPIYRRGEHFPGLTSVEWHGWDGSVWPLHDGGPDAATRGVILGDRVRGLHYGDLETHASESPAVDGGQHIDYRAKPREVFFTVEVYSLIGSADFIDLDRAWWRSMLPATPSARRGPGHLVITSPTGGRRWLELYPQHRGDYDMDIDPSLVGHHVAGQYLTAYRPFWVGDAVGAGAEFGSDGATQTGFFGAALGGRGPQFLIGRGSTLNSSRASNPGDEPVWLSWRLIGPGTRYTIGVDGSETVITTSLAAGEWIRVDTDPLARTVTREDGTQIWPTIAGDGFAPLSPDPQGTAQPLTTRVEGDGSIALDPIQPLYHRAW